MSVLPLIVSKCGDFLFVSVLHKTAADWILPVGLSFYSMQVAAYLTDIYRGKIEPQKNILKAALIIDGTEYCRNQRGLNFVIYDNDLMKVVDQVAFDTSGACNAVRW